MSGKSTLTQNATDVCHHHRDTAFSALRPGTTSMQDNQNKSLRKTESRQDSPENVKIVTVLLQPLKS